MTEHLLIILEYCENGDLRSYIRERRKCFYNQIVEVPENLRMYKNSITSFDLICWCYEIAKGMSYLASKNVSYILLLHL